MSESIHAIARAHCDLAVNRCAPARISTDTPSRMSSALRICLDGLFMQDWVICV